MSKELWFSWTDLVYFTSNKNSLKIDLGYLEVGPCEFRNVDSIELQVYFGDETEPIDITMYPYSSYYEGSYDGFASFTVRRGQSIYIERNPGKTKLTIE